MEIVSHLNDETLTESAQPLTDKETALAEKKAKEAALAKQVEPLLEKFTAHGKIIKAKRGQSNINLNFLLVNGRDSQDLAEFFNDRHAAKIEQTTGFAKVRCITFDHVLNHSTKKLAGLMNLELVLPLNASGEILDKHKTIEQFTTLKNLKRL